MKNQPSYQTGGWQGPLANIHFYFCPGDPGKIELTVEQASELLNISPAEYKLLVAIGEAPVTRDERLTLDAVSRWCEARIDNVSARERARKEPSCIQRSLAQLRGMTDEEYAKTYLR